MRVRWLLHFTARFISLSTALSLSTTLSALHSKQQTVLDLHHAALVCSPAPTSIALRTRLAPSSHAPCEGFCPTQTDILKVALQCNVRSKTR